MFSWFLFKPCFVGIVSELYTHTLKYRTYQQQAKSIEYKQSLQRVYNKYQADSAKWILLRSFARSIIYLISRVVSAVAAAGSSLPPLGELFGYSVARLGVVPVCQSLHKQKPSLPLRTNQHLVSISPLLWSAPSSVTCQRISLMLVFSFFLFLFSPKCCHSSFGSGLTDVWLKSLT